MFLVTIFLTQHFLDLLFPILVFLILFSLQVTSYPHMLLFRSGKNPILYGGERTAAGILAFLKIFAKTLPTNSACDRLLAHQSITDEGQGLSVSLSIPIETAITSFNIELVMNIPLTGISSWNSNVSGSGNIFTVTNSAWFAGRQAGQDLVLGFQVRW